MAVGLHRFASSLLPHPFSGLRMGLRSQREMSPKRPSLRSAEKSVHLRIQKGTLRIQRGQTYTAGRPKWPGNRRDITNTEGAGRPKWPANRRGALG